MQYTSLAHPANLAPPKLHLGGAFALLLAAATTILILAHHRFLLAALLVVAHAFGILIFRFTANLREQYLRTSPANDITRRVAAALASSLLQLLFIGLLLDLLFGCFSILLSS